MSLGSGQKRQRHDPTDSPSPAKRLKPSPPSSHLSTSNGSSLLPQQPSLLKGIVGGVGQRIKNLIGVGATASTNGVHLPKPSESRASFRSSASNLSSVPSPPRLTNSSRVSNREFRDNLDDATRAYKWQVMFAHGKGVPEPPKPQELVALEAELAERIKKQKQKKSGLPVASNGVKRGDGSYQRKKPIGQHKKNRLVTPLSPATISRRRLSLEPEPTAPLDDIPFISLHAPRPSPPPSLPLAPPSRSPPPLRSPSSVPPLPQLVSLSSSELVLVPQIPFAPSWNPETYSPPRAPSPHLRPPSSSSSPNEIDEIFSFAARPLSPPSLPSPPSSKRPRDRLSTKQHKLALAQRDSDTIHALRNGAIVDGLASSTGSSGSVAAEADEDETFLYGFGEETEEERKRKEKELYQKQVSKTADEDEEGISTANVAIKHAHSRQRTHRTTSTLRSPSSFFPTASQYLRHTSSSSSSNLSKIPVPVPSKKSSSRTVDDTLKVAKKTMEEPLAGLEKLRIGEYEDRIRREAEEARRALEEAEVKQKRRVFPARHTPDNLKIIKAAFSNRSFESSIKGAVVRAGDLARLKGTDWLNDETINFIGILINNRSDAAEKAGQGGEGEGERRLRKAFCFNTNFYSMLTQTTAGGKKGVEVGFEKVKRWTRRFDTFAKDIIIVPINLGGSHWVCAAVNFEKKRIEYYDSLGKARPAVYANLRRWVEKEHLNRKGTEIDMSDWEDYWDDDRPSQENTHDCGVFTCMFMETLSRDYDGFDFVQDDMDYLRKKLCLIIANKDLMDLEEWE